MKDSLFVSERSFYLFVKKAYPEINIVNLSYIDNLRDEYFSIADNDMAFYKAYPILQKIMRKNGYVKRDDVSVKHWKSLGYMTDSEIMSAIYRTFSNMRCYDFMILRNDDERIKRHVDEYLKVYNYDNVEMYKSMIEELYGDEVCLREQIFKKRLLKNLHTKYGLFESSLRENYWIARGFSVEYAKSKISDIQKSRSPRCVEYYNCSNTEAVRRVSEKQKEYSLKSKRTKMYWTERGYSDKDAEDMSKAFSRRSSVWAVDYWVNKGYDIESAKEKVRTLNPSSFEFCNYNGDINKYLEKIERCSTAAKKRYKSPEYRNKLISKMKDGYISSKIVSKSETKHFEFIKKYVDERVVHKPYIVCIPDTIKDAVNEYFYICDGFIDTGSGFIIVEYDSDFFHDEIKDEKRDYDIISIDKSVLGIMRLSMKFMSNKNKELKIKIIKHAIQEIENSEKVRIVVSS